MNVLKILVMSVVMMLSVGLLADAPLYVFTLVEVRSGGNDKPRDRNARWAEEADRSVLEEMSVSSPDGETVDLRLLWGGRCERICLLPNKEKLHYTLQFNINWKNREEDTKVDVNISRTELDASGGKYIFYFRDGKLVYNISGREQELVEDARRASSAETLYGDRCRLVFEVSEFYASAYAGKLNENDNDGFFWMLNVAGNAGDVGAMRVLRDWNRAHGKDSEVKRWEDMLRHAGGH